MKLSKSSFSPIVSSPLRLFSSSLLLHGSYSALLFNQGVGVLVCIQPVFEHNGFVHSGFDHWRLENQRLLWIRISKVTRKQMQWRIKKQETKTLCTEDIVRRKAKVRWMVKTTNKGKTGVFLSSSRYQLPFGRTTCVCQFSPCIYSTTYLSWISSDS